MFRLQVSGGFCVIFALMSMIIYKTVGEHTKTEVRVQLEERLKGAHQSLTHLQQLENSANEARAEFISETVQLPFKDKEEKDKIVNFKLKDFMKVEMTSPETYVTRHENVKAFLKRILKQFDEKGKGLEQKNSGLVDWQISKPYYLAVIDRHGICVADVNNPRCRAENDIGDQHSRFIDKYPSLKKVLSGERFFDLWEVQGQLLSMGVAPIKDRGEVIGATLIGYHLNRSTQEYKRTLLTDVGYIYRDQLNGSSSLQSREEREVQKQLSTLLKKTKQNPTGLIELTIADEIYLARFGEVEGYQSARSVQFFVTGNWSGTLTTNLSIRSFLMSIIILSLLASLFLFWISYHFFVQPIRDMELGVIELMNNNLNYWFGYEIKDNGVTGSLSQNLDLMVCKLSGREMPEMEDEDEM